jgi:hypothetical protein
MLRNQNCNAEKRKVNRASLFELGAEGVQEEVRRRGKASCGQKKRSLHYLLKILFVYVLNHLDPSHPPPSFQVFRLYEFNKFCWSI